MSVWSRPGVLGLCIIGMLSCGGELDDEALIEPAPDELGSLDDALSKAVVHGKDLPLGAVSLTFDDGPVKRTAELGRYLRDQGVSATFFVVGQRAERYPWTLSKLVEWGHTVANHTYSHQPLTKLASPSYEVEETHRIIAPYLRNGVKLFRAPYGDWNARVTDVLNSAGLASYVGTIGWEVGSTLDDRFAADWACWSKGLTVDECAERYLDEIRYRGRGIVLLHDLHGKTIDMVKRLVPMLKEEGYRFVRLDQVPNIGVKIREAGGAPVDP